MTLSLAILIERASDRLKRKILPDRSHLRKGLAALLRKLK